MSSVTWVTYCVRSPCFLPNKSEVFCILLSDTHLSKGSSGRDQKCTQFLTPFSGIVFRALSHRVIHFVRSVSLKNLEMEVCDWLLKISTNGKVVSQANNPSKMDHAK